MDISDIGRGPAKPIPPEIETVEGFLSTVVERHATFYEENPDGEFRPLLMVLCENGDVLPIITGFEGDEQKDMFVAQMRVAFKLWRVKSYVFAMEAWLSVLSAEDINEDGSIDSSLAPSQQPDRKEVIFTLAIDKDGNKAQNCMEIIRDYKGGAHLIPFEELGNMDFAGRFAELF